MRGKGNGVDGGRGERCRGLTGIVFHGYSVVLVRIPTQQQEEMAAYFSSPSSSVNNSNLSG